jgi:threonine/homoserine/homoserine lactone efflux protein
LNHNKAAGIRIAISPLFTDLPIIIISLYVFSRMAQFDAMLSVISFAGALFIAYLGYETVCARSLNFEKTISGSASLKRGIIANFLNPHPYLFWITVGTPTALKAYEKNLFACILFFLSFYLLLVGSKIGIALITERSKTFLNNKSYFWIMRILGITLFIFSVFFLFDGINRLLK